MDLLTWLDSIVVVCLIPLAVWFLLSGLDDFVIDVAWLWNRLRSRRTRRSGTNDLPSQNLPEKRIAIFVPLWHESAVIGRMLQHNLAALRYSNYEFIAGVYPNDEETIRAVRDVAARHPSVRIAICPHDGPTSKADCLNSIYRHMVDVEADSETRFDVVVLHDAEDIIHPESLGWINHHAETYEMVQIPVLALPTPAHEITHAVYCDEFAEFQGRDLPVRQLLGGFIPSCGVGTAYTRLALDRLEARGGQVFDANSLTEDYDSGLRLHRMGCPQLFMPVRFTKGAPVATREYFPRSFRHAVKQRTRWITGITFQAWARYGWGENLSQAYWFWRDRKGLLGVPTSFLANILFVYCIFSLLQSRITGSAWVLAGVNNSPAVLALFASTFFFQTGRIAARAAFSGRIYGWKFALGAPARIVWGNWINFFASCAALRRYFAARLRREPLPWLKTEHTYPAAETLSPQRRPIGEILAARGCIGLSDLESALARKPLELRLGEFLLRAELISESDLYKALSLQQNIAFDDLSRLGIQPAATRALPRHVISRWRVLPFKVQTGELFVGGPDLPSDEMRTDLRGYTSLSIRYQFITPSAFEAMRRTMAAEAQVQSSRAADMQRSAPK